jgi:hypothetical protein
MNPKSEKARTIKKKICTSANNLFFGIKMIYAADAGLKLLKKAKN